MKYLSAIFLMVIFLGCKNEAKNSPESVQNRTEHSTDSIKDFREFKVIDSKFIDNNIFWEPLNKDLADFPETKYEALKALILEQDIPTIQKNIYSGELSYEELTKFYLFRIRKFDRKNKYALNSVITINPNAIEQAKQKDREFRNRKLKHPIFGMPILLKDNINTLEMPTTAGAVALINNKTNDAFIVKQLKQQGAIILGKSNLSEWAYFFCGDCPSGYSAVGGQTLNPYGRRVLDTGGSSSGSGVAVAANFCVAAIGSETSGSILSPSSQNSVVGLKPTIGLLSRSGIVPISSTLDTPGPMTKNVTDNAILLDAILGYDSEDFKSIKPEIEGPLYLGFSSNAIKGKRFGAFKRLLEDSLYVDALANLKTQGAIIVEVDEEEVNLPGFRRLLNLDMKIDLPSYFSNYGGEAISVSSVGDVIEFNQKDSVNTMPYGQRLFHGIIADNATPEAFKKIKDTLKTNGRKFFNIPMERYNLDGFLSINNYHAGFAAVAEYPALTVPMGYAENGVPRGLTFIGLPHTEKDLLKWAFVYEQTSHKRKIPFHYN